MYVNGRWGRLDPAWQAALAEGWDAYRAGSNPIGAVLADADGRIVSRGRNRIRDMATQGTQIAGSRLAHAEVNALLEASAWTGDPRTLILHTTVEPCPLCAGAIVMANVRRVRYAARDPWAGSAALFTATTYLRGKGIAAEGPTDDLLELAVKAMGIDHMLRIDAPRSGEVIAATRAILPAAAALGETLHRSGELRALAAAGVDARTAIERVLALCGEAIPVH
jgi:tRNA(Arg) A34 adenosine deaminase TadA